MKYLLLFVSFFSFAQVEKFIPIDTETLEFISEVNYTLFLNKKPVVTNLTSKDSITRLPKQVVFDSIAFNKFNYKETGFKKESLEEVVRFKKIIFELDEVIVSNTRRNEIIIGEENRFIKRSSNGFTKENSYGILFRTSELNQKEIQRIAFFVEKVKFKTTYKIKFFAATENGNFMTNTTLDINELLFETPELTLEKGTKNKVEINLENYDINIENNNIFVCIEYINYFDENNIIIKPSFKDSTKLKFQLSNCIDYYAKLVDTNTKELTKHLVNINMMINRDFAYMFFKKPHKSNLVAPAIILYATQKK